MNIVIRFVFITFLLTWIAAANIKDHSLVKNSLSTQQFRSARSVDENEIPSQSQIKDASTFLEKCLKKKVLRYTVKPLTKRGDNYNFQVQSLEVDLLSPKYENATAVS